jgi:hypothetical protein
VEAGVAAGSVRGEEKGEITKIRKGAAGKFKNLIF